MQIKGFMKLLGAKIVNFFKNSWALFLGIIFTWVIPLCLLAENVALTKEVSAGVKLTFMGCLVVLFLLIMFRKKIYEQIIRLNYGWLRAVLKTIYRGINYGLFLGILWGITYFADDLFTWWIYSGISILVGVIFYIIHELTISKKLKEKRQKEILDTVSKQGE